MFLLEADRPHGVAVVVLGPPATDGDWRQYVEVLETLNAETARSARPVLMQIIQSGTPFPDALTDGASPGCGPKCGPMPSTWW